MAQISFIWEILVYLWLPSSHLKFLQQEEEKHAWTKLSRCVETFFQEVLLKIAAMVLLASLLSGKYNWNVLVYPDCNDYWLVKQWLVARRQLPNTRLSATLSSRALENCPHICPRAFWQHPFAPSAESQLIMSLVNLGLSTTCLHNKCKPHAQAWIASFGITAVFPSFNLLPKSSPSATRMDQY